MIRSGGGSRLARWLALATCALVVTATEAGAQYFGRNKVQYETFDFRVLRTPHFDIHFYREESLAVRDAARMAERWNTRLSTQFGHQLSARKPVILYANHPDFQQTNVISGGIDEGTGGVTESLLDRVVLPLTGVYGENDHVMGHELVHVYQYDIAESPLGGGVLRLNQLPLWLIEGMAEYLSVGREDPLTAMWLRDAALRKDIPTIKQLTRDPRYFPYRYGQALWAYIGGKWGDDMVPRLYRSSLGTGFDVAIRRMLGITSDSLSKEWIAAIRDQYTPLLQGRSSPKEAGERVLSTNDQPGDYNLSPVLSPDGRYVAFFSRRGLFSIDLFVADARSGRIIKKLTNPGIDSHFDAISFIHSAGSWSPDGRKFAFITFAEGDNEIEILDVDSRRIERRIHPPDVGAITTVAWSPDGAHLAFSGIQGGVSDLFLYSIANGAVRRLTNDRHADLHPAWSPDSRTIAFATDRGEGTDFERLRYSQMRIAFIDVASAEVKPLPLFEGAKHINPQFSTDGSELFFISDRQGFSDIYRLVLASGELFQVTKLATGVSGIAELSPAMSVARESGRMLFSVFDNSGFKVFGLDKERTRGEPVARENDTLAMAGVLPLVEARDRGSVTAYLRDADTGLPPSDTFPVLSYRPKLRLQYLGQPSVGVGFGGRFGTQFGGGASAYFGDILGNRTLGMAIQASGTIQDFGGEAVFLNAARRWNWGVAAGHLPYLTGFVTVKDTVQPVPGGSLPVTAVDYNLQRVFIDQLSLFTQYPLSTTRRFEISAGASHYGFRSEIVRQVFFGGSLVNEGRRRGSAPDGLTLFQAGAAYVGDNSFFGFTSPISGTRWRFEASPTFGSLQFQTVLADFRRYFFVKPFTLAVRAIHYGRYGADADTARLSPLFLGEPTLVRGYTAESFDGIECERAPIGAPTETLQNTGCPQFSRLLGSRIGVANAELRIPLLGTRELGLIRTNLLPVEIAPFLDAGVAWTAGESPLLEFDKASFERTPVFSAGVTTRLNLFGFAILEVYWAHPFQRPRRNSQWGFNLTPGW